MLTAETKPAASFDGKPCRGNARIEVTFQIKDQTYVANEGAALNQDQLKFEVVRTLNGNRKHPDETIRVTAPQVLSASFTPDYFDRKDISCNVGDAALISVDGEDKSAAVQAKKDAKWIRDLIAADQGRHVNTPYEIQTASGSRTTKVTVIVMICLETGRRHRAEYRWISGQWTNRRFVWKASALYRKRCNTRSNAPGRGQVIVRWRHGREPVRKKLAASVFPAQAFNQKVTYQASDDSLYVSSDGTATVNTTASWIQELDRQYLKSGSHTAYADRENRGWWIHGSGGSHNSV